MKQKMYTFVRFIFTPTYYVRKSQNTIICSSNKHVFVFRIHGGDDWLMGTFIGSHRRYITHYITIKIYNKKKFTVFNKTRYFTIFIINFFCLCF